MSYAAIPLAGSDFPGLVEVSCLETFRDAIHDIPEGASIILFPRQLRGAFNRLARKIDTFTEPSSENPHYNSLDSIHHDYRGLKKVIEETDDPSVLRAWRQILKDAAFINSMEGTLPTNSTCSASRPLILIF